MDFKNANELLNLCKKHDLPISEVMRQREIVGLMAYRSAASAYEYAKCWLALVPDDPAAQKLVRDLKKKARCRHCLCWAGLPGHSIISVRRPRRLSINPPIKEFGGKDSVKGNRQGSLSRWIKQLFEPF